MSDVDHDGVLQSLLQPRQPLGSFGGSAHSPLIQVLLHHPRQHYNQTIQSTIILVSWGIATHDQWHHVLWALGWSVSKTISFQSNSKTGKVLQTVYWWGQQGLYRPIQSRAAASHSIHLHHLLIQVVISSSSRHQAMALRRLWRSHGSTETDLRRFPGGL